MENAAAKRPLFTEAFSLFRPEDGALRALIDGARVVPRLKSLPSGAK